MLTAGLQPRLLARHRGDLGGGSKGVGVTSGPTSPRTHDNDDRERAPLIMSRSITKRGPHPARRCPLALAVLGAVTALVAAACSAGSTTRAAGQRAASHP